MSVGIGKVRALTGVRAALIRDFLILLATLVVGLLAASFGGRFFIRRPVRKLTKVADRWRASDLAARTVIRESGSEFGKLGAAFDSMATALETRSRDLAEESEKLRDSQRRIASDLESVTCLYEVGSQCVRPESEFKKCLEAIIAAAIFIMGPKRQHTAA